MGRLAKQSRYNIHLGLLPEKEIILNVECIAVFHSEQNAGSLPTGTVYLVHAKTTDQGLQIL